MVRRVIEEKPRTRFMTLTDEFIHTEFRSCFFRFVNDLYLKLRTAESRIAVRSASRVGHSDFSVNRKRVESLRAELRKWGVIH